MEWNSFLARSSKSLKYAAILRRSGCWSPFRRLGRGSRISSNGRAAGTWAIKCTKSTNGALASPALQVHKQKGMECNLGRRFSTTNETVDIKSIRTVKTAEKGQRPGSRSVGGCLGGQGRGGERKRGRGEERLRGCRGTKKALYIEYMESHHADCDTC